MKRIATAITAGLAIALVVAPGVSAATETIVVSGNTAAGQNMPGWLFNRDLTTQTPYEFNTEAASIGEGSLYVKPIGANPSDKFVGENFLNAQLADVKNISYDFQLGEGNDATDAKQFYLNVYANFGVSADDKFYDCRYNVVPTTGAADDFTTVTFDPTQAYDVTTRGGASASPFACPAVPADMNLQSPDSSIRAFALNVGDTTVSDLGVSGYFDNVVAGVGTNVTTYDFDPEAVEPEPVVATSKDQCKDGGFTNFVDANGNAFKNQGSCVSFVASKGKSQGNAQSNGPSNPIETLVNFVRTVVKQ